MSVSEAQPRHVVFPRASRVVMQYVRLRRIVKLSKLGGREISTKLAKLRVRLMQKELKFLFCGCVRRRDMQDQGGRAAILRKASSWLTKHIPAMGTPGSHRLPKFDC